MRRSVTSGMGLAVLAAVIFALTMYGASLYIAS